MTEKKEWLEKTEQSECLLRQLDYRWRSPALAMVCSVASNPSLPGLGGGRRPWRWSAVWPSTFPLPGLDGGRRPWRWSAVWPPIFPLPGLGEGRLPWRWSAVWPPIFPLPGLGEGRRPWRWSVVWPPTLPYLDNRWRSPALAIVWNVASNLPYLD